MTNMARFSLSGKGLTNGCDIWLPRVLARNMAMHSARPIHWAFKPSLVAI